MLTRDENLIPSPHTLPCVKKDVQNQSPASAVMRLPSSDLPMSYGISRLLIDLVAHVEPTMHDLLVGQTVPFRRFTAGPSPSSFYSTPPSPFPG